MKIKNLGWVPVIGAMVFALSACGSDSTSSSTPAAATAAADPNEDGGNATAQAAVPKVTICHIPPGNPDNAHSITVGAPAVPAHRAHGDPLGPCPTPSPTPTPTPEPTPTPGG